MFKKVLMAALCAAPMFLAVSAAPRPADADTVLAVKNLIVSQTINVGTVTFVQTSATNLRVTYLITVPNYFMTGTHLYVGSTAPKSSSPGKFTYKNDGLAYVTTYVYNVPVPTGAGPGSRIYFAAHADVVAGVTGPPVTGEIVSDTTTVVSQRREGDQTTWTTKNTFAVPAWVHPSWADTGAVLGSAIWIWEPTQYTDDVVWSDPANPFPLWPLQPGTYHVQDPIEGTIVDFSRTFTIPAGATVTAATLEVAADNGFLAFVNGNLADLRGIKSLWGSGDTNSSPLHGGDVPSSASAWTAQSVTPVNVLSDLAAGINTLRVIGINEYFAPDDSDNGAETGTLWTNPGGIMFRLQYAYTMLTGYTSSMTGFAQGGGTDSRDGWSNSNWFTYFSVVLP